MLCVSWYTVVTLNRCSILQLKSKSFRDKTLEFTTPQIQLMLLLLTEPIFYLEIDHQGPIATKNSFNYTSKCVKFLL